MPRLLGQPAQAAWARSEREKLDSSIQACAWDGNWFIWAIGEDGTVYSTHEHTEGQVYLNTQVWSVISGAATSEQAGQCMQAVRERLATPYGLMLSSPPFVETPIYLLDLFPATRQRPHTLAHRCSGLGVFQRHTVRAGAAARGRRAADCPVYPRRVARLPRHPRLPGSDLSHRRQACRSRQRGFADGGWQPGGRERRPPAARRAGGVMVEVELR